MSAFAALGGMEGDTDEIKDIMKKKRADEAEEAAAAAKNAVASFEHLKSKAGQMNWADDEEDEDEGFFAVPVRPRPKLERARHTNAIKPCASAERQLTLSFFILSLSLCAAHLCQYLGEGAAGRHCRSRGGRGGG